MDETGEAPEQEDWDGNLERLGSDIDSAVDAASAAALDEAQARLKSLLAGNPPSAVAARLHYFDANIWSGRADMAGERTSWAWTLPAREQVVLALRRSVGHEGFASLSALVRAQVLTNLANELSALGRPIEALEMWDRALAAVPSFAMAHGNRGLGLGWYSAYLYDPRHKDVLLAIAAEALEAALDRAAIWDSPASRAVARPEFRRHATGIGEYMDAPAVLASIDWDQASLGRSRAERRYRRWCLENRLFLNPLNDIAARPIAAHDVLTLPDLVSSSREPPSAIRAFNLLKAEYAAARLTLFEGLDQAGVHWSDRGVLLYDTLDYPAFGTAVERIKLSFRAAYSLFDKIALVLNDAFEIGHTPDRVSFGRVWLTPGKKAVISPRLDGLTNAPLRGLFWLSRDLREPTIHAVLEPDATELADLRNHLEHRLVSVHVFGLRDCETPSHAGLALSLESLEARSLRVLKLARGALIHLAMTLVVEEHRGRIGRDPELVLSLPLLPFPDRWKRRT